MRCVIVCIATFLFAVLLSPCAGSCSSLAWSDIDFGRSSHALLVGAWDYDAFVKLENIPSELDSIESVLRQSGFTVDRLMNPSGEELRQGLRNFILKYGYDPASRILIFFGGHGFSLDGGRTGFVVPVDAPHPKVNEILFRHLAVDMGELMALARKSLATHVFFMLDACASGAIFKTKSGPNSIRPADDSMLRPVRQFLTSGGADEVVPGESRFVPAFVNALHGQADVDGDGYVTASELARQMFQVIPHFTGNTPQFGKINDERLSRGEFVFRVVPRKQEKVRAGSVLPSVSTDPPGARVCFLDFDGVWHGYNEPLVPGRFVIEISAEGFSSLTLCEDITERNHRFSATLSPVESAAGLVVSADELTGEAFVKVDGGSFRMGDAHETNAPLHDVYLDTFWIGQHEVTQRLWVKIMESNPSAIRVGDQYPVTNVSVFDVQAFLEKLNAQAEGGRYQLPTEAQWEYAARDRGKVMRYSGSDQFENVAVCGSVAGGPQPVGSKASNGLGIYDMSGNVAELCRDSYESDGYAMHDFRNPEYKVGSLRSVIRGGSWGNTGDRVTTTTRTGYANVPSGSCFVGFRLVWVPDEK